MPKYTVEIRASNADGSIWQPLHPAETVEAESAADAALTVAQNQNIAEGTWWRVLAWEGEDADTSAEPAAVYNAHLTLVGGTEDDARLDALDALDRDRDAYDLEGDEPLQFAEEGPDR